MKIKEWNFLVFGYLLLLVVNFFEIRSGAFLASVQLALGLFVFVPQLNKNATKTSSSFSIVWKIALLLSLFLGIYLNWFDAPNHLYLFTMLTLIMVFKPYQAESTFIRENVRWIFITLMAFATIHKFVHPNFISGDFVGLRMLTGSFFRSIHLLDILPETTQILEDNRYNISQIRLNDPISGQKIRLLTPINGFGLYIKGFTYFITLAEFLLTLLYIIIPYKKFSSVFLLLFICSIGFVVPEFEFIATLLFIGTILCVKGDMRLNKLYRFSFIVYCGIAIVYNLFQHLR